MRDVLRRGMGTVILCGWLLGLAAGICLFVSWFDVRNDSDAEAR
jgi:hypothetical protein